MILIVFMIAFVAINVVFFILAYLIPDENEIDRIDLRKPFYHGMSGRRFCSSSELEKMRKKLNKKRSIF